MNKLAFTSPLGTVLYEGPRLLSSLHGTLKIKVQKGCMKPQRTIVLPFFFFILPYLTHANSAPTSESLRLTRGETSVHDSRGAALNDKNTVRSFVARTNVLVSQVVLHCTDSSVPLL